MKYIFIHLKKITCIPLSRHTPVSHSLISITWHSNLLVHSLTYSDYKHVPLTIVRPFASISIKVHLTSIETYSSYPTLHYSETLQSHTLISLLSRHLPLSTVQTNFVSILSYSHYLDRL
jgi:hypothetical protein